MFGRVTIGGLADDVRTDTYRWGSLLCNAIALVVEVPPGNPSA
jgi:hypothetical protein